MSTACPRCRVRRPARRGPVRRDVESSPSGRGASDRGGRNAIRGSWSWPGASARAWRSSAVRRRSSAPSLLSAAAWSASIATFIAGSPVGRHRADDPPGRAAVPAAWRSRRSCPSAPGYVGTFELTAVSIASIFNADPDAVSKTMMRRCRPSPSLSVASVCGPSSSSGSCSTANRRFPSGLIARPSSAAIVLPARSQTTHRRGRRRSRAVPVGFGRS